MPCKLAVLLSGSGTNLQSILDAERAGSLHAAVSLVIANKAGAFGLERARRAGVPTHHISIKTEGSFDGVGEKMLEVFERAQIDLVVLAGYLKLLHPDVVRRYLRRIINIHPALLPKFGGPRMYGQKVHQAVIAAGETESGASVHFVDEIYDHGEIIAQRRVPVQPDDTAEVLQARVLTIEHQLLPETIRALATGKIPWGEPASRENK